MNLPPDPTRLTFWFEFASSYSYPAAARIEALAAAAGVAVDWQPVLLGPLFAARGWRDSPFNLYPAKGAYMWRDLARVTAALGLPFRRPSVFPRNGLLAARIAVFGRGTAWQPRFVPLVYRANFADDQDIADPLVLAELVDRAGGNPSDALTGAATPATKASLRKATEAAQAAGLFGAPSFTVGGELFWGNDRLEQALDWARQGR